MESSHLPLEEDVEEAMMKDEKAYCVELFSDEELKFMLVKTLESGNPITDKEFVKAICNELAEREKKLVAKGVKP